MSKYDVVVIGGGPAGITLSKMLGKKFRMAVIRPEDHGMIYCAMPYAIEGLIGVEKVLKKDNLVTDSGAELLRNKVAKADFGKKKLHLQGGSTVFYDKLVIATGATPVIPSIPGRDLKGVTGFRSQDDLDKILGLLETDTVKAVVVGAGAVGVELSLALSSRGIEVHLVDANESVLPDLLDDDMTGTLAEEIIRTGIHLHLKSEVTGLAGHSAVEQISLSTGETIHFDSMDECSESNQGKIPGVVVFDVQTVPELSLFKNNGLALGEDGIIVNDKMETSIPDVYAVGDCVQFTSGITGKVVSGKLATNAVPMAKVLGFNLLGQKRTYPGFFNGTVAKVGQFFVGGTGLTGKNAREEGYDTVSGSGEATTRFPIMPEAKEIHLKMVADRKSRRLLGAQIVSGESVSGLLDLLTFAIQKKTTIEELTALSYSSQPFQSFFPAANIIVLAAEDILKKI